MSNVEKKINEKNEQKETTTTTTTTTKEKTKKVWKKVMAFYNGWTDQRTKYHTEVYTKMDISEGARVEVRSIQPAE